MDPRQSLSRTASSHVPQNNYHPNTMATSYPMSTYQGGTLPPINYPTMGAANQQPYLSQQSYRNDMQQRYPPSSTPSSGPPQERYITHMAPPSSMQAMPQNNMLPQPQSQQQQPQPQHQPQHQQQHQQQPPPQAYQGQQPTRPNYQQPLAPAPPRPNIDPMSNSYGPPDGRSNPWSGPDTMPGMPADMGRDPTRTHVVGSQGRRGILPSDPGRPPVTPNGLNGSPKGGQIPQKDADGKFPCPNCTKTYLHAKHLKRHMLRHTGDRPYMCVLCNDTFSRSDILKRHFQKCSVRRGNPTGASHLSNPAAHLKKSQAAAAKAAANAAGNAGATSSAATTPVSATMPPSAYTTTSVPANSVPTTAGGPQQSMSYPVPPNHQNDHGPPHPSSMQPGQGGPVNPNAHNQWASMHNAGNAPMMYHPGANQSESYSMQHGNGEDKRSALPNPHPIADHDWNMFQGGNNDQYMNPIFSGYNQSQGEVKSETHEGATNGYYMPPTSLGADGIAPRATK